MRLVLPAAALAVSLAIPSPVFAQGYDVPPPADEDPYYENGYGAYHHGADDREAWLADCRQRISQRDSGAGGALIGGAVGALAGNRIAGRGNRTVGTIGGAAVGAVAGAAIDKAEDRARNRDECEAYLDDYYAQYERGDGRAYYPGYQPGYTAPQGYYPAYGYGYPSGNCCATPMMMVPVIQPKRDCVETVEYVYEDVPVRPARRVIPRRAKAVPDKRVRIVPDKRVPAR